VDTGKHWTFDLTQGATSNKTGGYLDIRPTVRYSSTLRSRRKKRDKPVENPSTNTQQM
jgi:hypothetical protein